MFKTGGVALKVTLERVHVDSNWWTLEGENALTAVVYIYIFNKLRAFSAFYGN